MEEFQEIAMLHESDRSPIEMDTAQSLITFSQESVIREAYSPQRSAQSFIQFSEETAAIRQSHCPEKATINSDEDIIIKEENEDESVIKMIRRQDFEKETENITALVHDNDKNGTVKDKINMSVQERGDGDKIHDGSTVEEGNATGEQIGDGSPVEEGNGIGGSPVEEGNGTVEEIGHDINTEISKDDDEEGEQLETEDKESAIYKMIRRQDFEKEMENITALVHDNNKNGTVEDKINMSVQEKGDGDKIHDGSTVEEGNATGEQIGDGSPVEEGNGIGGSPVEEGNGMVEEIGHDINTEISKDDDEEGEQLETEDKESAIYW